MAGGDLGQFDLRALQRVGDVTNDRAEWKRWGFVFQGCGGCGIATVAGIDEQSSRRCKEKSIMTR